MKSNNEKNISFIKNNFYTILFCLFSFVLYAFLVVYAGKNWIVLFYALFVILSVGAILKIKNEFLIMSIILSAIGLVYFIMAPIQLVPDENAHFYRSFEISMGHFMSKNLTSIEGSGDILPAALQDFYWNENRSAIIDWKNTKEISFSGAALYSPLSYIPQTLGILIGRIFTKKVVVIFYLGRLFNFLTAMFLSLFALKKIPFGKKLLFVIMCFPITMQEMISLSPDAITNALSFLFIAYILYLVYEKETVSSKDIVLLAVMLTFISLLKIVYIILFLLIYMIPNKKFKDKKSLYILKIAVPITAVVLTFLWVIIASRTLFSFSHNGSNPKEQMKFVLLHPANYICTIIRTIFINGYFYLTTMFGASLGWLNINVNAISWCGFLILLVYLTSTNNEIFKFSSKIGKTEIVIFVVTFLGAFGLVLTSLYVQWTSLGAAWVDGVQGRYFIPVLPCLLLPFLYTRCFHYMSILTKDADIIEKKSIYVYIFVIFFNLIAILDIMKSYTVMQQIEM